VTNVLFLWPPEAPLRTYLADGVAGLPQIELVFPPAASEEALLPLAAGARVMVGWRPTPALLAATDELELFINPGAGVQHLIAPFRELNERRPVILVNGHGNSYFTAQHAVALLLALTNRVVLHHNWMAAGRWRLGDAEAASIPLRGRRVGLLGYGHVNRQVHRFLAGFDVEFAALRAAWPPSGEEEPPTALRKFAEGELHPFLEYADALILSVPETARTRGLIGPAELALLGAEGLLVNVARGAVVDEEDLYEALRNGTIAGAALDVWYDYRPEADRSGRKYPYYFPFHDLPNVVLSPHRAASPFGDLARWDEVVENLKRFAYGREDLLNVVDLGREY
jgi:phosphoglycerate dehydrogenase-like enzyme